MILMSDRKVRFTKHALYRARQKGLWKYVNKKKFFYDAIHLDIGRAILDRCVYVFCFQKGKYVIITMYYNK